MRKAYYILKGKLAVPVKDVREWGIWFETADRIVAADKVGGVRVSTVFLGIDHNFGDGLPLIFETMAFRGGTWDELYCERCGTWEEAEAQHKAMCDLVRREIKEKVND
jgi:hypothetical protein